MTAQRQRQAFGRHAVAIINHTDERLAAAGIFHADTLCAGIECVLDQFLDRRSRALDHFARSDSVGSGVVELPDFGQRGAYVGVGCVHNPKHSMSQPARKASLGGKIDPLGHACHDKHKPVRLRHFPRHAVNIVQRYGIHEIIANIHIINAETVELHPCQNAGD